MIKIVVLDGHTLNPGDLSWRPLEQLGQVTVYPRSTTAEVQGRAAGAAILLVNKQILDQTTLSNLKDLKFIGVTATGYNNVDVEAANELGIKVANVSGYSTPSVAQHVFALLLSLTNKVMPYNQSVQTGTWSAQLDFTYVLAPIIELQELSIGIYGLGKIGQAVAQIALAMGMTVRAHHKHPERDAMEGVEFVDLPTLFRLSNIVSLHAPLSPQNREIVNRALLSSMPKPAYLINTGRGGLVHEEDLAYCLKEGVITAAGLDVLSSEPPSADHPLIGLDDCIITPHVAWGSQAARKRLLAETVANVAAFLAGNDRNIIK
ncbi:MAG: D-2-hydroxyacid dehydrogenase [Bacteroidota bacterium]